MQTVLIVDADTICYRAAAATEGRSIEVTHLPTGKVKVFKNRTELKTLLKSKGRLEAIDDYLIIDQQEPEPIENCLSLVKRQVNNLIEFTWCDSNRLYLGKGKNFRHKLALPKAYKGNRLDMIRPVHLDEARNYLVKHWGATVVEGREADDQVVIEVYKELDRGNRPILAVAEKDLYQCEGVEILNYTEPSWSLHKIDSLGHLREEGKGIKGEGLLFLCYQWCCSDPSDNYCAYDLSNVKFGPKKAYNLLKDCKTEAEVLIAVKEQFKKFYPEPFEYTDHTGESMTSNWFDMMQMYYTCCRMQRYEDDPLDCRVLFEKYGVTL